MSEASVKNLEAAAAVAAAASVALAGKQGEPMDAAAAAQVLATAVAAAGPLLNPNVALAMSLGTIVLGAVHAATQAKTGLTHEDLVALFAADDAAKAADAAAQAAAG